MAVFFWYLGKSEHCTVTRYRSVHWTSHFLQGTRKTWPCLSGDHVPDDDPVPLVDGVEADVPREGNLVPRQLLLKYSVTQSLCNNLYGDVVLDNFNTVYSDEDSILDQTDQKQIYSNFYDES